MAKRKSQNLSTRLGRNIAAKRKELGLTQDRLAEMVGVDTETISRFERGATAPSLATLEILANKLRASIAELLDEELPKPTEPALVLSAQIEALRGKDRAFLLDFVEWLCKRNG